MISKRSYPWIYSRKLFYLYLKAGLASVPAAVVYSLTREFGITSPLVAAGCFALGFAIAVAVWMCLTKAEGKPVIKHSHEQDQEIHVGMREDSWVESGWLLQNHGDSSTAGIQAQEETLVLPQPPFCSVKTSAPNTVEVKP